RFHLAKQVTSAAAAEDLLYWAAKIDVNHIKTGLHEPQRGRRKIRRISSHQLPTYWMLFVGDSQAPIVLLRMAGGVDELIKQDFAKRARPPQPPCDKPHRGVAVARQRRLHYGKADLDISNAQR